LLQLVLKEPGPHFGLGFGGKRGLAEAATVLDWMVNFPSRQVEFAGPGIFAGMAMQDVYDPGMKGTSRRYLEGKRALLLETIKDFVHRDSIVALKLYWEHPDDPNCLKGVLERCLGELWPEDY
jgi:hypothetical protein